MIKVLLVDDEFLVCSFLKNIIIWEDYGYSIVGQASNGTQALEKISQLNPELIFLDVSMPELDGIELIHIIHNRYPSIKVIMLSSYSDYNYVRETMKMGAVDYLLKHQLNSNDLIQLLTGLGFETKENVNTAVMDSQELSGYNFNVLRDSRTRSFFEKGRPEVPEPLKYLRNPMMTVAKIKIYIADITNNGSLEQQESFIQGVLSTCIQICNQEYQTKVIYQGELKLIFLFSALAGENVQEQELRVQRCMNIVHDAILKYHNIYLHWKQGRRCQAPEQLPQEYSYVLELFEKDINTEKFVQSFQLSIEQERQIILSVLGKNKPGIHEVLTMIFMPMTMTKVHSTGLALLAGDILTLAVKLYKENHVHFCERSNYEILNSDIEKTLLYFDELFITLINHIDNSANYSKTITTIIDYVDKHYKGDISLNDIGRHCSMNPSYLSTIFKKETGVSFVQYINRIRVYNAGKRMLMEGITPTQVFEHAGFNNYNNFFTIFKSITGMTPTQFIRQATVDWIAEFNPLKK